MKIHYFNPVLFPYSMIQDGFPILKWYFMSLGTNSTISSGQKCTNFEIEKSPGFRLFFYCSSPIFPIFFTHFPHFLHPFYPFSAYCIIRNMLNFQKSPKSSLQAKVKAQILGFSQKKGSAKMADFDPILRKFLYLTHLISFYGLYAGMIGYSTC